MKTKEQLQQILNRFEYPHPASEDLDDLYISGECTMTEVYEIAKMAGFMTNLDLERLKKRRIDSREFQIKQRKANIPGGIWRIADIRDMDGNVKAFSNLICSFGREYLAKGLIIIGADGSSKTYTACAVANDVLRRTNRTVQYEEFSQFFNALENLKAAGEYIQKKTHPDLLIIDNVMLYSLTDYKLQHFLSLIRERDTHNKQTIITTNLSLTDFYSYLTSRADKKLADATIKTLEQFDLVNVKEFKGVA